MRKMLTLISALAALVAFGVPTVAQADDPAWYINGQKAPQDEEVQFSVSGKLRFQVQNSSLTFGYCSFEATSAVLMNTASGALAEVGNFYPTSGTCPVSITGCGMENQYTNPYFSLSLTGGNAVRIDDFLFGNNYPPFVCYLPREIKIAGQLTGVSRGPGEAQEGCILYEEAGSVKTNGSSTFTDGELCFSSEAGVISAK